MALAPTFVGQKFAVGGSSAVNTIEIYLDYVCPFSKRMFDTVYRSVFPIIEKKYSSKVQVIFRQQVQPWHPQSTLVHEAGVAVLKTNPTKFWEFSAALFDKQKDYFDANVVNETRNATYKRLAQLAASVGLDEKDIYGLLEVSDKPDKDGNVNFGNGVSNDFKLLIRQSRLLGIHASPTVLFNGLVENSISSGWTPEQWEEFLQKNVV